MSLDGERVDRGVSRCGSGLCHLDCASRQGLHDGGTIWRCLALAAMSLVVLMPVTGASASSLPDGRGWELVSPVNTGVFGVTGIATIAKGGTAGGGVAQASADGNSVTFLSPAVVGEAAGAPLGNQYLSRRNSDGWQTTNISTPMVSHSYSLTGNGTPYKAFSSDLVYGLLLNASARPSPNPSLSAEEPEGYKNYYLSTNLMSVFQPLVTEKNAASFFETSGHPSNAKFNYEIVAATPDLRHIIIETAAALTPGASETGEGEANLYEWSEGNLSQLNLLPNGEPMAAAHLGTTAFQEGVLSDDGKTVVLTEPGKANVEEEKLYVRDVQAGETHEIDIGETSEKGTGVYATASADGKTIFFTDRHKLTSNATAAGEHDEDLYAYDVETEALVDLTTGDPSGAAVQGVLGASGDGRYVYFVANGVLTSAPNDHGALPLQGGDNLYVSETGADLTQPVIRFIATLSPEDNNFANWTIETKGWAAEDWAKGLAARTARISEDGRRAVFMSSRELTNYNNHDSLTGNPDDEVYVYEVGSPGKLVCVSCRPDGTQPEGPSWIPGGTPMEEGTPERKAALYRPRVLSESGQVFFGSDDGIVLTDTNHGEDVYEYEGNSVALISSGTSLLGSSLIDASASGNDVFFTTAQSLTASDTNGLVDIYDARQPHVSGEVVSFPENAPVVPCDGETCLMSRSAAPVFGEPQSQVFSGAGQIVNSAATRSTVKHMKGKTRAKRRAKRRRRAVKHAKLHTSVWGSHGSPSGEKSALKGRG